MIGVLSASQADGRPPCINGDIAIQLEWSNFDPSQNQNPLTDYTIKLCTMITSTRRTRNPKGLPIDPKGASGQIREI